MREEIVYYCDVCNTAYDNREDAVRCETSHVPDDAPPQKYGIGDILQYYTTIADEEDIQYARLDEDTPVFWDPVHKTWVYRLYGDDIMEEGITLVMSAAEYAARLQDIRTQLESEYTVTLPNRFPGPYIDIRLYPRSKTESGVEARTTVFDQVTQSPEKLAKNSFYVHVECNRDGEKEYFFATPWTDDLYETIEAAVAAAATNLKKVRNA